MFSSKDERKNKILSLNQPFTGREEYCSLLRKSGFKAAEVALAQRALDKLASVSYGNREPYYVMHASRVSRYYVRYAPTPTIRGAVLGLLHNLLEVSNVTAQELEKDFGSWTFKACQTLTIDRDRQKNDPSYIPQYYSQLQQADREVQQVKIFDKLDNLLVLFLNPSKEVRAAYLKEIEDYLIPMIEVVLPNFAGIFRDLVKDAKRLGHLTPAKYLETVSTS